MTCNDINIVVYKDDHIFVDIFDLYGNKLKSEVLSKGDNSFSLQGFNEGVYVISLKGKSFVKSIKVIKVTE
jgi:hypothetical protein